MSLTLAKRAAPVPESTSDTSCGLLGVREIELRGGGVAFVDEADYPLVAGKPWRVWRCRQHTYSRACLRREGGRRGWPHVLLHRFILGLDESDPRCVDHIDGDGLNNRRSNLRICTRGENSKNRGPTVSRLGFKGVFASAGRFGARYNECRLGGFDTAIEAALAYNDEAKARAGRFARPNAIHDEQAARDLIARRDELRRQADAIDEQLRSWPCA